MINGYWEDLEFHVQEGTAEEWKRIVDTALPGPNDFLGDLPDQGVTLERTSYLVAPRSIVMLLRTRRR
jgi:glycogen operon protein